MKKILITGNGFDLHHQLPTKYENFIDILKVIENSSEFNFHSIFSEVYKNVNELIPFDLDKDKINLLKGLLENNLWYNHFKDIKSDLTWIDFENEILSVLEIIQSFVQSFNSDIFSTKYFSESLLDNMPFQKFIESNELIKITLLKQKILGFKTKDYQINSPSPYYYINDTYLISKSNIFYLDVEKIIKLFITDLDNFKLIFNKYFECFVSPFYLVNEFEINKDLVDNITDHYTFNYTPTFDVIYKKDFTRHIHGKIGEVHSIVLGIDHLKEDIENKKLYIPFTKLYQKLNYSTDYKFIGTIHKKEDFYLFFWGHSLDSSDAIYIKEAFTLLEDNDRTRKVIIIIRNQDSKGKLLINLIDILGPEKIDYFMKEDKLIFSINNSTELSMHLNYKTYKSKPKLLGKKDN